jgi:hypothetical protein
MQQRITPLFLALGLATLLAAPAHAQMWNFPDYMVPGMRGAPTSWVSADFGRGLNEASGEENAFGAAYGRTGEAISFMIGAGIITGDFDDEFTFGAAVGGDFMEGDGVTLGVQGGFGWVSPGPLTLIRIPVGLTVRSETEMEDGGIVIPWVMPRLNFSRWSGGGDSDSELDLGISGGVTMTLSSGVGFHAALDYLLVEGDDPLQFGLGIHYLLGSSGGN